MLAGFQQDSDTVALVFWTDPSGFLVNGAVLRKEVHVTVGSGCIIPRRWGGLNQHSNSNDGKRGDGAECCKMKLKLFYFKYVNIILERSKITVSANLPPSSY